jgi:hypothetical protein
MDALVSMRGSDEIVRSTPVRLYWELYSFPDTATVSYTVSVRPVEGSVGLFARIGRAVGLSGKPGTALVSWSEKNRPASAGNAHSVTLNLSQLRAGEYELEVSAVTEAGQRASTRRVIELVNRTRARLPLADALEQRVGRTAGAPVMPPVKRRDFVIPRDTLRDSHLDLSGAGRIR